MLALGPDCLCFCDRLSVAARPGIDDLPGGRVNVCLSVSRRRRRFMQTPCPYPTQEPPWLDRQLCKLSSSRPPSPSPSPPLTGTRHSRYFAPPEYVKFPLWTVSLSLTAGTLLSYSALPLPQYLCTFSCGRRSPINGTPNTDRHRHSQKMQTQMQMQLCRAMPKPRCRQTSPSTRGHRRHLSRACMLRPTPYAICYALPCPALPCPCLGACCAP